MLCSQFHRFFQLRWREEVGEAEVGIPCKIALRRRTPLLGPRSIYHRRAIMIRINKESLAHWTLTEISGAGVH